MQMSLGTVEIQADAPAAGKQTGQLGKVACRLDGSNILWSASRIFFLKSPKIARCNVSHKTKAIRREEINSQLLLETAVLAGFTLLMLYNVCFPG